MKKNPNVVHGKSLSSPVAFGIAIVVHCLLFIYHRIRGYTSPGTNPIKNAITAARYDIGIVDNWREALEEYTGDCFTYSDKSVLELGPGPDVGVGVVLLGIGAKSYTGFDVNALAINTPRSFYYQLSNLCKDHFLNFDDEFVQAELEEYYRRDSSRIRYVVDVKFDLSKLSPAKFDLIVSQAAFEHFDDPLNTISQLPLLMNPGGIVIIEVDLKTHTPKLREIDPLNIYRVPAFWYDAFSYAGVPNRVRPEQYLEAFELAGFSNVKVVPISILSEQSVLAAKPGLSSDFKGAKYDMSILSVYIIASIAARESSG